jgi:glycosyltransferase involved in cell wall biosynthesis
LRIVYLANSTWPRIRGAGKLLLRMIERGLLEGHDVTVLAPAASAIHAACRAINARSVPVQFSLSPSRMSGLRAALRESRPEIVHGMSIFPVAFVRRLRLLPVDGSVRYFAYVSTDPTSSLPVAAARFRRPLLFMRNAVSRAEAPRLDALFVASDTIARRLPEAGIRGRVVVIPGAVDPERLEAAARLPLDLPPERPRIGYAAFLERLKGIDDLIVAFARIATEYPTAVLLLAGDGPEEQHLRQLTAELGVAERVRFLGHLEQIAPLLAALDLFVSPSRTEALGMSILEAMAMGVPCVCTDAGGVSDVICDGESGLVVSAGDPDALAVAMCRVLGDASLAARLAQNGHALAARPEYSLAKTLDRMFFEYAEAIDRAHTV